MSHTPGPWEWTDEYATADGRRTWSLVSNGYGILSCDGTDNSPSEVGKDGEANARLIAAAPELLEACEAALDAVTDDDKNDGLGHKLVAAIAKAKGENK